MFRFLYSRLLPFLIALLLGYITSFYFDGSAGTQQITIRKEPLAELNGTTSEDFGASGYSGACYGRGWDRADILKVESLDQHSNQTQPLRITSKPKAQYTDLARVREIRGTVTLRVTFLASGKIGGISVINSLPAGLTENAVTVARRIRFEPKRVKGIPKPSSRLVAYKFDIY